jgi:DNA polymerase-1
MSAMALQEQLLLDVGIAKSVEECQAYLDAFFTKYPKVHEYIEKTKEFTQRNHYTYTFTGHRRRFPMLAFDSSQGSIGRAMRQAVNARIQTTSADLVNLNIVQVHKLLKPIGGRILLTVHDSIAFQVPRTAEVNVSELLQQAITTHVKDNFPELPVEWKFDMGKGPSYGEAH